MKRAKKIGLSIGAVAVFSMLLMGFSCSVTPQGAANVVNKYANSLEALHDGVNTLHTNKVIGDDTYYKIEAGERVAVLAVHNLDAAITVAAQGGDITAYIQVAQTSFDGVIDTINSDPAAKDQLKLVAQAAGDALQNAITIIKMLHDKAPAKVTQARNPHGIEWALGSLFLVGLAAGGGMGDKSAAILQVLQLILAMEPTVVKVIAAWITSMKGKSAAEIIALNEGIADHLDQELKDELAAQPPKV